MRMSECAICCESVEEGSPEAYTTDCQHTFHAACLVQWMRREGGGGMSCPLCRHDLASQMDGFTVRARAKYLRRTVARRRSAPPELLRCIQGLQRAEAKEREARAEVRAYMMTHKEVLHKFKQLKRRDWSAQRRARDAVRALGVFQAPGVPLPPMVVGEVLW